MSKIKWGQRCIARRFEDKQGVIWEQYMDGFIGKECIVIMQYDDGSVSVSFEDGGIGRCFCWLPYALEFIPEPPSVWWPEIGQNVMHRGETKTITDCNLITHQLDRDEWVNLRDLSPVTTTEITPDEAVKLLEQHTGKSFTIKSK